ncbi:MAG: hypothetical protein VKJ04_07575 [Vampirovibrionales bacterium]|nr:hypothetical protein [Vampirovibrionales bacterium]
MSRGIVPGSMFVVETLYPDRNARQLAGLAQTINSWGDGFQALIPDSRDDVLFISTPSRPEADSLYPPEMHVMGTFRSFPQNSLRVFQLPSNTALIGNDVIGAINSGKMDPLLDAMRMNFIA